MAFGNARRRQRLVISSWKLTTFAIFRIHGNHGEMARGIQELARSPDIALSRIWLTARARGSDPPLFANSFFFFVPHTSYGSSHTAKRAQLQFYFLGRSAMGFTSVCTMLRIDGDARWPSEVASVIVTARLRLMHLWRSFCVCFRYF